MSVFEIKEYVKDMLMRSDLILSSDVRVINLFLCAMPAAQQGKIKIIVLMAYAKFKIFPSLVCDCIFSVRFCAHNLTLDGAK